MNRKGLPIRISGLVVCEGAFATNSNPKNSGPNFYHPHSITPSLFFYSLPQLTTSSCCHLETPKLKLPLCEPWKRMEA